MWVAEKKAEVFIRRAFCSECGGGELVNTGKVEKDGRGAAMMEHECYGCGDKDFFYETFPGTITRDAEEEEKKA